MRKNGSNGSASQSTYAATASVFGLSILLTATWNRRSRNEFGGKFQIDEVGSRRFVSHEGETDETNFSGVN